LLHTLLKAQKTIAAGNIVGIFFAGFRMIFAEKFYDVTSAFVDVEMNVALLKIRGVGFPDFRFRVEGFNCLPGSCSYAFAVAVNIDIALLISNTSCIP